MRVEDRLISYGMFKKGLTLEASGVSSESRDADEPPRTDYSPGGGEEQARHYVILQTAGESKVVFLHAAC